MRHGKQRMAKQLKRTGCRTAPSRTIATSDPPHYLHSFFFWFSATSIRQFELQRAAPDPSVRLHRAMMHASASGCVVGIIAHRVREERPDLAVKDVAVDNAVAVAIATADTWVE